MADDILLLKADASTRLSLLYFDSGIQAGFPSPAEDHIEASIDLNKELIDHPATTFFGRVRGESLSDAGINEGDILVIDKSLSPKNGDMAVCFVDGAFTVKFIKKEGNIVWLKSANPSFKPIKITPDNGFMVWGIVTYSIKKRHFG